MAFRIGNVEIKSHALLAPLAGFTDQAFRRICRRFGAGLSYTEMVSAKGLVYGNENTAGLLALAENETPSAVQIFGSDPEFIARAVERLQGFDVIDINMGCPVPKIVKNGEGSALMRTPEVAEAVVDGAALAAVVGHAISCVCNAVSWQKYAKCRKIFKNVIKISLVGVIMFCIGKLASVWAGAWSFPVMAALAAIYVIAVLRVGAFSREECKKFPLSRAVLAVRGGRSDGNEDNGNRSGTV